MKKGIHTMLVFLNQGYIVNIDQVVVFMDLHLFF